MRQALAAAGAALIPETIRAAERLPILPSDLTAEDLAEDKHRDVVELARSVPPLPELGYLREKARHLELESQMYIPTHEEVEAVFAAAEEQLRELGNAIKAEKHGLFVFADAKGGRQIQRLYVVRKEQDGALRIVKGYPVSMALLGFSNEKDSRKTPIGLHSISEKRIGLLGEVVSGLNKHRDSFKHVKYQGADHWFVRSFDGKEGDDVAEVVTDQYLLTGPHTPAERGIRIHGTNRSGTLKPDGTWESYLGGKRRSGGCIRMSNVDVRDLHLSGYLDDVTKTPVMIFPTEAAQGSILKEGDEVLETMPKRWTDPGPVAVPEKNTPAPAPRRDIPNRWHDPERE